MMSLGYGKFVWIAVSLIIANVMSFFLTPLAQRNRSMQLTAPLSLIIIGLFFFLLPFEGPSLAAAVPIQCSGLL